VVGDAPLVAERKVLRTHSRRKQEWLAERNRDRKLSSLFSVHCPASNNLIALGHQATQLLGLHNHISGRKSGMPNDVSTPALILSLLIRTRKLRHRK
jgi:hypothetical protein